MNRNQARRLLVTSMAGSTCVVLGGPLFMLYTPAVAIFVLGMLLAVSLRRQRTALRLADSSNPITWVFVRSEISEPAETLGLPIRWLQAWRIGTAAVSVVSLITIFVTGAGAIGR